MAQRLLTGLTLTAATLSSGLSFAEAAPKVTSSEQGYLDAVRDLVLPDNPFLRLPEGTYRERARAKVGETTVYFSTLGGAKQLVSTADMRKALQFAYSITPAGARSKINYVINTDYGKSNSIERHAIAVQRRQAAAGYVAWVNSFSYRNQNVRNAAVTFHRDNQSKTVTYIAPSAEKSEAANRVIAYTEICNLGLVALSDTNIGTLTIDNSNARAQEIFCNSFGIMLQKAQDKTPYYTYRELINNQLLTNAAPQGKMLGYNHVGFNASVFTAAQQAMQ